MRNISAELENSWVFATQGAEREVYVLRAQTLIDVRDVVQLQNVNLAVPSRKERKKTRRESVSVFEYSLLGNLEGILENLKPSFSSIMCKWECPLSEPSRIVSRWLPSGHTTRQLRQETSQR